MFIFESSVYRYDELVERSYLEAMYRHLCVELGPKINDYEIVLWADTGAGKCPAPLLSAALKPRVLVYISDETSSVPFHLSGHFTVILKSYLPREHPEHRIFAMPLGYAFGMPLMPVLPINQRTQNVFFTGCPGTHRMEFAKALLQLAAPRDRTLSTTSGLNNSTRRAQEQVVADFSRAFPASCICFTTGFGKGLDHASYARMLHDSKIALCPRGWKSSETFRHFEAMRAGCVLISDSLPSTRLYRDAPIIRVKNWSSLGEIVHELLASPERMSELQQLTMKWWEDVCSERASAIYLKDMLLRPGPGVVQRTYSPG